MADTNSPSSGTASIEQRVAAVEAVFEARGMEPKPFIETMTHAADEEWVPQNGARVVAKAWTDPAFRERLLNNRKAAVTELGLTMPPHHRHLVALENTSKVHNVICCTLCFGGHVRMPGYIRGKPGVVVSESPAYPFPDAHAHGVSAADEPTYDVAFRTEDLWPNSADPALVHVGVFRSYLDRAD